MADSDFEKIKPAEFDPTAAKASGEADQDNSNSQRLGMEESRERERYRKHSSRLLWGIFSLLLLAVAGVVFVLPRYVTPPAADSVAISGGGASATGQAVSPYQEAQRLQQREEAQNVLAELLDLQDSLESIKVQEWAGEDFAAAITLAESADEAYRQQQFIQARQEYQRGLDLLRQIDARSQDVFNDALQRGSRAIETGEPETAAAAFELALSIDGDSEQAQNGLERAQVLDDVLALVDEAAGLREQNQLEPARERYREAQAIDPLHGGAQSGLEAVNQAILDRDFSGLMSRGYASLQSGEPEQARDFFDRALALKPDSSEAGTALEQAGDQITSSAINRHLDRAREHAGNENWQQALTEYNEALAIDPNVVAAMQGQQQAQTRLNLDNYLVNLTGSPLRLAEDAVYQQALRVYDSARAIADPGPRLRAQLQQVGGLLEQARQAVNVSFRSDGQTRVTVYRVAELGQFTSETLALVPGTYTAVGVRDGYRDVREEFVVAFNGQPPVVTIACEEQVL